MKTRSPITKAPCAKRQQRGSALITAAVVSTILALVVAGYLSMLSFEYSLNFRSHLWTQTLHLAEMGIEVGLRELNYQYLRAQDGFRTADGWSVVSPAYRLPGAPTTAEAPTGYTKTFANIADAKGSNIGSMTIQVYNVGSIASMAVYPIMVAQGFIPKGAYGPQMTRTIKVIAGGNPLIPIFVMARGNIATGSGNTYIDSYNSLYNLQQTGSPAYNPLYKRDKADIGTNSTLSNALDLNNGGHVYGIVRVGPGGGVARVGNGSVGPFGTPDGVVANGYLLTDFVRDIPSMQLPANFGSGGTFSPSAGNFVGSSSSLSAPVDYTVSTINGAVTITGNVRIFVTGNISLSGKGDTLKLNQGAKASIYVRGNISVTGNGEVLNITDDANALYLYGLPTCTGISLSGTGFFIGSVYAPDADIVIGGGSNLNSGGLVGKTLNLGGGAQFHFDEALKQLGPIITFGAISWREVVQ